MDPLLIMSIFHTITISTMLNFSCDNVCILKMFSGVLVGIAAGAFLLLVIVAAVFVHIRLEDLVRVLSFKNFSINIKENWHQILL